jgi:hypothetical protein
LKRKTNLLSQKTGECNLSDRIIPFEEKKHLLEKSKKKKYIKDVPMKLNLFAINMVFFTLFSVFCLYGQQPLKKEFQPFSMSLEEVVAEIKPYNVAASGDHVETNTSIWQGNVWLPGLFSCSR